MTENRIVDHPVLGPAPGERITLWVDGQEVEARATDTVAGALWANGKTTLRTSRSGQPRGLYCGIGHCFECRVTIDTETGKRACLKTVEPGMQVETGRGG